jgi:hypothetical protein
MQKEFVFDIILSVGAACKTAHYLKRHGLRFCANPLDWMMSYSLDTVIHLYKTGFNDFFMDFVDDKQKSLEHNCHWYTDSRNNIISMHYDDIEKDNETFRAKMKNRFEKINQSLLNANSICFISCRNEDINIFKEFLKEIGKMYFGKITYINIKNNKEVVISPPIKYYKEKVSERLELIEYEFNDIHPKGDDLKINGDAWKGNYIVWDNIMEKISLRNKINFLKYLFKGEDY